MNSEKRGKRLQKNQGGNKSNGESQSEKHDAPPPNPPGGYDASPVPHAPPGYTVRITFHRATHLPIADLATLSSDPFLLAEITTALPSRHKEDPPLTFRTRTIWKSTHPEWNQDWILAHVPASGFKMKIRVYDEDSSDKDDRLGNVHISVGQIDENWGGIKDQAYKIKKKSGSIRAYTLRGIAVCFGRLQEMSGHVYVSVEVLGKSEGNEGGRTYTIGRNYWTKHRSPLLGRLTGSKDPNNDSDTEPEEEEEGDHAVEESHQPEQNDNGPVPAVLSNLAKPHNQGGKKKHGRYNFQANQFQLRGPVPPELYHRYVEFRPFVKSLFTSKGVRGLIMHKGLHIQHDRVYNFNRQTEYGEYPEPGDDMTRKFLELVHHDAGGRIFTYVLTLDALLRFTETGKEFGIDMLSKHTMHSDASIYIAFSGEFFIRRLKHPHREPPEMAEAKAAHKQQDSSNSQGQQQHQHNAQSNPMTNHQADSETENETHPPSKLPNGPPKGPPPRDPAYYEIIIDNDSGTYRPNAELLPKLRHFLESNFPGLKVTTLDGQKDKELMDKLKGEQRAIKKSEGSGAVYAQVDASSLSSGDVETMQRKGQRHVGDDEEQAEGGGESGAGGPKHKLGEALGPMLGNHSTMRKLVGAGER